MKKIILFALISILIVTIIVGCDKKTKENENNSIIYTIKEGCPLMTNPSSAITNYGDNLNYVRQGEKVRKINVKGEYYKVRTSDNKTGWIHKDDLLLGYGSLYDALINYESATALDLRGNRLDSLSHDIGKLTHLKELYLNNNSLKSLPQDITNLNNLEILSLNGNSFDNIPSQVFQLTNLKELYFREDWCDIEVIPPEIGDLKKLEILDFYSNVGFKSLPSEIGKLKNLKTLMIHSRDSKLDALPPEIGNLVNLEVMELLLSGDNGIESLPPEIFKLKNLKTLTINSKLESLPDEIGNLVSLEYLDLGANDLTSLPSEIGNLVNLEKLDLSSNDLTSLPPEIGNLINLEVLNLKRNKLTSLPDEIKDLKDNLKKLSIIKGNNISLWEKAKIRKALPNTEGF